MKKSSKILDAKSRIYCQFQLNSLLNYLKLMNSTVLNEKTFAKTIVTRI